jgi:O-antigen/teichoic acid export membrane protein
MPRAGFVSEHQTQGTLELPDRPASLEDDAVTTTAEPARDAVAAETAQAMRGLFGRDSIYLLVWALQVGVAALSIPITTRLLGATFGVVATAMAVMQILVAIAAFSLPTAIQRVYRPGDAARESRRTITLTIVTAVVTAAVATLTRPYWIGLLRLGGASTAIEYAIIWASLTAMTYAGLALLRSANRLALYAIVSLIQSVVSVVVSVALVVFVHRSATEFVFGQMISQAAAAAVALIATRPLPIRIRDLPLVRKALIYSGALVPGAMAGFVLSASDRLIIRHYLPLLQASRYGAVYNIAAIPVLLLSVLDTVWMPRFFALTDRGPLLSELLADSRDALYRLLIPAVLALSFAAPLVLSVWIPPSYHPAGLSLVVVTISVSAFPAASFMSSNRVLLISGNTGPAGLCMVAGAAFNVAANIVLVPAIGLEGAALATLLAYVLLQALILPFSRRSRTLRRPPLRLVAACTTAAAIATGVTAIPATGAFAVLRALATLGCAIVFAAMLQSLVAPERKNLLSRRAPVRLAWRR